MLEYIPETLCNNCTRCINAHIFWRLSNSLLNIKSVQICEDDGIVNIKSVHIREDVGMGGFLIWFENLQYSKKIRQQSTL
jgi:hypothetical protein